MRALHDARRRPSSPELVIGCNPRTAHNGSMARLVLEGLARSVADIVGALWHGSFAAGFLPPSVDLCRPHGVQEDDDVHWKWAARSPGQEGEPSLDLSGPTVDDLPPASSPSATERVRPRIRRH